MTRRSLSLVLALVLTVGLFAGCKADPEPSAAPTDSAQPQTVSTAETETQAPDWAALYAEAAGRLEAAPELTMVLTVSEDRNVGGDTLTEAMTRTARFQGRDTKKPVIHVKDLLDYGLNRAAYELTWSDGLLFAKLKEARYYSKQSLEDFLASQLPAVLLRPENYASLTGEDDVLRFAEPLHAETWAMPEDGILRDAAGSAVLTDGTISAVDYEITYEFGGSVIHAQYHADLSLTVNEDLSGLVPENVKGYESLDSVEAAILLYRARQALENSTVASTEVYGNAYAQAGDRLAVYTEETHSYGTGTDFKYREKVNTTSMQVSTQKTDAYSYSALINDGVLTEQYDEDEPEITDLEEEGIDPEEFGAECLANLHESQLELFPNYNELVDASMKDLGDYCLIEFTPSEDFTARPRQELNLRVFGEVDTLERYATDYVLKSVSGYLAVEKHTWLPTSLHLDYTGVYTVYGNRTSAVLAYYAGYSLYDPDTYEEITEEPLPDTEPEEKPNPVFYKVSGKNGESMYLFGTIHVGDDRTGFLPQSIYDAFRSADALAVEFDTDAFTEKLEEDEALQARIREQYLYTDGTTVANHLDSELYRDATELMKAAGQYTPLAEQYRPFVWSQQIEGFYLSQGRRLTSSKGVDNRLMALAREQEKEILNVESGEFQIGMLAGYSDQVQEMLLAQTAAASRNEHLRVTYELYELWCEGDEAALIERVAAMTEEERAEIDEDDLAVYDEYHQKMELERNAHMLEVAEDYLRGGKTVFFAVGLAHLLGEGGLVEALRAAGYTVTLVQP